MVGKTAGATIKLYIRSTAGPPPGENLTSVGLDLSINDQEYLWTAHAVIHRPISGSPLNLFLGPGAAFGSRNDELFFGPSSALGIFFDKHRFEVFMQVTPRIVVSPYLRGEFGSAVGLRYYL